MGIWQFNVNMQELNWCEETYKIFDMVKRKDRPLKIKDYLNIIHLDDAFFITEKYNKHLNKEQEFSQVHKIITTKKIQKWIEIKCITTFDENGKALVSRGTIQDVTENKQNDIKMKEKDKQMMHQSRLAQMGEMISMIAHQWRQPLNAISLTSNNLKLKCMMDDIDKNTFEKELDLIEEYSQHLSKTIEDFRGFFKENKEKESTSLNTIVNNTLNIIRTSIETKNVKIITNLNSPEEFETYPNEVMQVVLNIIKNAEDAIVGNDMKDGLITISANYNISTKKKILTVEDNAGGIPLDIIEEIFVPYFSTKKEKDGTGLGLYMSKTIIEDHCSGKISAVNNDKGAVFTIE